jgi:NAD(P)-dependent dehydrogenase (short-subunit alcohol dehydrogenase family)
VSPGVVDTPLWRQEPEEKARLMKEMEEKMMTGRVPLAEDVAESFLVVLKDCNMTGSMISTNGGALFK